jgi:hypothetical protein
MIRLHPHALARMQERGASREDVEETIRHGETFAAKHGRDGFRKNFTFDGVWQNRPYRNKQVEAYAVQEPDGSYLVITVLVKYF